jgi:hypothetical protein
MNILSIIVIILFYFIVKYVFRIISFFVILKMLQQLQINMRKSKKKGGEKK